ncbi:Glucan endo-1,3-beta-glucosidase 5 [Acorus gramineus]|uniref:glucan endo-1,3-beta-D-glucosidase n=1 Tax=Acorus gramineus TaxID=55184 RepID=A0AAV9AI84_ACOGR|nr:Glucan endo-1,3-beta-glucosidase 5 [Acorus gramineus]
MGPNGLFFLLLYSCYLLSSTQGLGFNWGTRSSHPLPGDIVVRLLKDNGIDKVKLFEADPQALSALGNSGIEVMLGIPNEFLAPLASTVQVAEQWVMQNVSQYISKYGVDIRSVAVGNEPFLKNYKGMLEQSTYTALQNIQAALIKAGLARQVKITVPLNSDVYQTDSGLPSGGDFRADIRTLMISITKFLIDNGGFLTVNIYPFLSLYADPNFPADYAFFDGSAAPVVDGSISYSNVFEANYDTLIWTLEKNGFSNIPIVVGEIGWPTDGDINANVDAARRFNQGLLDRISSGQGTPKRKTPPEIYLFGLIDEDMKSVDPGNFERHWGLFFYDGTIKYQLRLTDGRYLTPAKSVKYLPKQWCVLAPGANNMDPTLAGSIGYACTYADCTSLGYGSTCNGLDAGGNASYAFNAYYQTMNQKAGACTFNNLAVVTRTDPSIGKCRFEVMIDIARHNKAKGGTVVSSDTTRPGRDSSVALSVVVLVISSLTRVHHALRASVC